MNKTSMKRQRVALGMSGGVDSSVSAHLLTEQGYDVTGVYLECWRAPGCRSEEDRQDALKVALALDIPFQVLDFKQAYKDRVVDYFFTEYAAGRTPNPDVMCNKEIKFGLFYDWAMANGFDYVATGHYARSTVDGQLLVPADSWKDQTYFLYRLSDQQLQHILFPLGELTKQQVRVEAHRRGLHVADKKDSVGICFIGDIDVRGFLKDRLGEKPGEVVDIQGNVIGEHQGIWFSTIGQRHGFTIKPTSSIVQPDGSAIERTNLPPFYVIGKNAVKNQLIVGFGNEALQSQFILSDVHLINQSHRLGQRILVRIRHTGELNSAALTPLGNSNYQVQLDQPLKGVAEGQSAVLYESDGVNFYCVGGGVIAHQPHLADELE